jgi:hypothetical protein
MNPVDAKIVSKPEDWLYSNYRDWINLRHGSLVDQEFIKDHFNSPMEYVAFCTDLSGSVDEEGNSFIERYRID